VPIAINTRKEGTVAEEGIQGNTKKKREAKKKNQHGWSSETTTSAHPAHVWWYGKNERPQEAKKKEKKNPLKKKLPGTPPQSAPVLQSAHRVGVDERKKGLHQEKSESGK